MALTEDIISKLVLALILGGLIGAEREYRSKSAGFRTIMMICLGATLFTIFSLIIGIKGTPILLSGSDLWVRASFLKRIPE